MPVKRALTFLAALVLIFATGWGVLVLLIAGPAQGEWARVSLVTIYLLCNLAALMWVRPFWQALIVWAVGLLAVLMWWDTLRPTNNGNWQQDVAKLSWAEIHGEQLRFHNVRNFAYRTKTDFTPRYEARIYDLSKLRGLDIFISYWGPRAIAHTIMSWDFADTSPLAISIETRKQKGQDYSAVKGFFRQYEIIYVAADESDIVRLRTNYLGEDVYLYRLMVTPEQARALLLDYVTTMNALVNTPEFYNALVDNCTTSIHQHVKNVAGSASRFDWRLLANGYGDEMLYDNGRIDTRLPFEELRARSHINARATGLKDSNFSLGIRQGLPNPRDLSG
jgi:hypothetical protein